MVHEGMLLNFEGDFDAADTVWRELKTNYPAHPAGPLFSVETLFWRQIYDIFDRSLDAPIKQAAEEAARVARAWLDINDDDARAYMFAGQSQIQIARFDGMLRKFYSAGKHAERGRRYLQRAQELDPGLTDVGYWLGLYYYYPSTVEDVLKYLSWLWFVPEPNASRGLHELYQVSRVGDLQQLSANLALLNIHTYFQRDYEEAARLAYGLNSRFPGNSFIHFELIRILQLQDRFEGVIDQAERLESQHVRSSLDRGRILMARVWRARAMRELGRSQEAEEVLGTIDIGDPDIPTWGLGWVHLLKGQIHLDDGDPETGLAHLQLAADMARQSPQAGRSARRQLRALARTATDD